MFARRFLLAVLLSAPVCIAATADSGRGADAAAIHRLIERYARAVDTVDLSLLAQIWSHSPDVSFIYPLGEEHGFEAIEKNFFQGVMGDMFSKRDLRTRDVTVHADGNAAWAEFHWTFHAVARKDGSAVTTNGVETQIYRKEGGTWRLVHVHYSEEPQPAR